MKQAVGNAYRLFFKTHHHYPYYHPLLALYWCHSKGGMIVFGLIMLGAILYFPIGVIFALAKKY